MNVAQAIARGVAAEGATHVFGLMGDGNMDFMAALRDDDAPRIAVWDVRHEGAAVGMADGFSRASDAVGVATVTNGPGVTQLGTALTVASRRGSPIVVVGGDAMTSVKGMGTAKQDLDQRPFVAATGALFHQLRGPATVAADVQHAFWLARTRRQPVFLNCPIDIQEAEVAGAFSYVPSSARLPQLPALAPDPRAVAAAGDLLANARRPVFVVGAGAVQSGARKAIDALADRLGAALATTLRGKGYVDGRWSVGIFGTFATATAEPILAAADTVVFIGTSVTSDVAPAIATGARTIVINTDPLASVNGRRPDVLVLADARLALEAIDRLMGEAEYSARGYRAGELAALFERDAVAGDLALTEFSIAPGTVDPRRAIVELDRYLPGDCTVVTGTGHLLFTPSTYLSGKGDRRFIYAYDFGCIGQALPIGIGAEA